MDGTGVPMVSKELEGRKGKGSNGRAHTREVQARLCLTQTTVDAEGWPVRDEDSTTYTGAIETAEEFSRRLYTEASSEAGTGHSRKWSWETVRNGSGTGRRKYSREPPKSWISITLDNTLWDLSSNSIQAMWRPNDAGDESSAFLDDGKIELL